MKIGVQYECEDIVVAGQDTAHRRVVITIRVGQQVMHIEGRGPTDEAALHAAGICTVRREV